MLALAFAALALASPAPAFHRIAGGFAPLTYVTTAPSAPSTLYLVQQNGVIKTWPAARRSPT